MSYFMGLRIIKKKKKDCFEWQFLCLSTIKMGKCWKHRKPYYALLDCNYYKKFLNTKRQIFFQITIFRRYYYRRCISYAMLFKCYCTQIPASFVILISFFKIGKQCWNWLCYRLKYRKKSSWIWFFYF